MFRHQFEIFIDDLDALLKAQDDLSSTKIYAAIHSAKNGDEQIYSDQLKEKTEKLKKLKEKFESMLSSIFYP